jgi:hypothetical protein
LVCQMCNFPLGKGMYLMRLDDAYNMMTYLDVTRET